MFSHAAIGAGMAALLAAAAAYAQPKPQFSFGVMADIQYANADTAGPRAYRDSIGKVETCEALLAKERPVFVIQLGDFVDRGLVSFDTLLPVFDRMAVPKYHVLGNHDFIAPQAVIVKRLGMPAAWYAFERPGWRFVVLDGMQENADDPAGMKLLETLRREGAPNAQTWNGALGRTQRAWLRRQLREAAARGERAIVFCHFPALPESCRPQHLLWDHEQVVAILDSQPAVVAYFNGHDHNGGYAERNGIHYLTFPAMVEHAARQSCFVVDVFPKQLVVRLAGEPTGRGLAFR